MSAPRDIFLRELAISQFPESVGMADRLLNRLNQFGFVIVPKLPTEEMIQAGEATGVGYDEILWAAMIEARPT